MTSTSSHLLGPADIRELAAELELTPTKKLGQNFLLDANTVRKIVRLAKVNSGDAVLEIGPGLGSLTLGLTEAGARVTAVEIDTRLAKRLPHTVADRQPNAQLTVLECDALSLESLPEPPLRLVANLPYNVSVPIIVHMLERFPSVETALVMVQSEVGERIAAVPGSKNFGVPSVKAQWYGQWQLAAEVSRQVFWPVPNVDSVLVTFQARQTPLGTERERRVVFDLVDAAFSQRRKMLRQSLRAELRDRTIAVLTAAEIDETLRAEDLNVEQYVALARAQLATE